MEIVQKNVTIRELADGYFNDTTGEQGVRGYHGLLNIRPKYQREFIYGDKDRDEVVRSVMNNLPINVIYWFKSIREDGSDGYEMLDGQQRTISICGYVTNAFSVDGLPFQNLPKDRREDILNYPLLVFVCEGKESERLKWFNTINTRGQQLTDQELLNAVFAGPWLEAAKRDFSRRNQGADNFKDYLSGSCIRQDFLRTAIYWIARSEGDKGKIQDVVQRYMSAHKMDTNAELLWNYFEQVMDWVKKVFPEKYSEMKGLDWGELYEKYHENKYDCDTVKAKVSELRADVAVQSRSGIFEYVLDGCNNPQFLNIRIFSAPVKAKVYKHQTLEAKARGVSNCPLCAISHVNNTHIWEEHEMEADHVKAWENGGNTDISNCQMLCITHNRAKGNH